MKNEMKERNPEALEAIAKFCVFILGLLIAAWIFVRICEWIIKLRQHG